MFWLRTVLRELALGQQQNKHQQEVQFEQWKFWIQIALSASCRALATDEAGYSLK